MNNFIGYYKTFYNGKYIDGYGIKIDDNYFLQVNLGLNMSLSNCLIKVNTGKCAKQLCELPSGDKLYEFDVFQSENGELFYIIFDVMRLAIVYLPVNENEILTDINLFASTYVGNMKIGTF